MQLDLDTCTLSEIRAAVRNLSAQNAELLKQNRELAKAESLGRRHPAALEGENTRLKEENARLREENDLLLAKLSKCNDVMAKVSAHIDALK